MLTPPNRSMSIFDDGDAGQNRGDNHLRNYAGKEGQRIGRRHEIELLITLYRWGWATNATLAAFADVMWGVDRGSLGSRKWKKGLLVRRSIEHDAHVRGDYVYALSPAPGSGFDIARARLQRLHSLAVDYGPQGRRHNPPTKTLPHLLHCQLIALALMDEPTVHFWSEPECRRVFTFLKAPLIPDLILWTGGKRSWVEYDRSPKKDLRLWLMAQQYHDLWAGKLLRGRATIIAPPYQLVIVVPTVGQRKRYQAAFDSAESPVLVYSQYRKRWERVPGDYQDIGAVCRGRVKVMTLTEALGDLDVFL